MATERRYRFYMILLRVQIGCKISAKKKYRKTLLDIRRNNGEEVRERANLY